jgi:predicted O-methyltransferase YrrM
MRIARNRLHSIRQRLSRASARRFAVSFSLPSIPLSSLVPDESAELESRIADHTCLPPFPGQNHDDFTPLMKIARFLQSEYILELGTAHGNTVANLCRQCSNARIFTVNAPASEQTGKLTTYSLTADEIGSVYRKYGYSNRITQILANTLDLDLSPYLPKQSVDLAIIDACHDTNYVINDFHKVYPYIKSGGIVLFHDTHSSMNAHLIGSYRACMHLRKNGFDIRHIEETWWGVWSPKWNSRQ